MSAQEQQAKVNWQSHYPVWTLGALCVAVLFFAMMCWVQYAFTLSELERLYVPVYASTGFRAWQSDKSRSDYQVLYVVNKRGQQRLALPEEIETAKMPDGQTGYRLNAAALAEGWARSEFEIKNFNDAELHAWLASSVYGNQTLADELKLPGGAALVVFVVLAIFAGGKDRQRAIALLRGQRVDGTEQVSVAGFNRRMRRRKKINGSPLLDGVVFLDAAQSWLGRTFNDDASRGVYVPREREQQHIVMMGDSGSGKTTAIRQVLLQAQERGELAIVYDASGQLTERFYDPARGDIILNGLDARCPFISLADEIGDDAEAMTLAASMFPDREHENRFFVDAPRRIIAYLLCLRPTPDELVQWLIHPAEIDRRVRGTELESLIDPRAPAQRAGVLASLTMIADALKLLPREEEAKGRFSTAAWAKQRRGWIFITSTPETRVPLRPLISLWIDLLVMRLMRTGAASGQKTWFVIDEMHSLQRLPQLATALTETRKANVVMVLGFQGRAQIVDLYGSLAESLLSQPATKLFFKTSDPDASGWIERAIGKVEYLRYQVSESQHPQGHDTESQQRGLVRESLVMDAKIMGLDPLEVYFKHGLQAVHMWIKYIELPARQPAFVQRERTSVRMLLTASQALQSSSASSSSEQQLAPQSSMQHEFVE
jgi:Type IV secretion-system coupling protein DNA-binding domain